MTDRFDIAVIGGGTAGLTVAAGTSRFGVRVALIERDRLGGECLWTGCVPSKALIRSARLASEMRRAGDFGLTPATADVDFTLVMDSMRRVRNAVGRHDDPARFRRMGVEVIHGEAALLEGNRIRIGSREIVSKRIVIATGSRPAAPAIPGLEEAGFITHVELFDLGRMPRSLAVLGAGPIGIELAQTLSRFGCRVTVIEMLDRILPREDAEVSALVGEILLREGIDLILGDGVIPAGQLAQAIRVYPTMVRKHRKGCRQLLHSKIPGEARTVAPLGGATNVAMGARQFFITGGEPFLRSDIVELAGAICEDSELVILTNAMLFRDGILDDLMQAANGNVRLQISLDGPDHAAHDGIRGQSFDKTLAGIQAALKAGFQPTVSTVVTRSNLHMMTAFPKLLASMGVTRHHLLWPHKRGRAPEREDMLAPETSAIISMLEAYLSEAARYGIELDNYAAARERVAGRNGVKVDLSGAGVTSLCVYADGTVYPSAALAGAPELRMGNVVEQPLESLWKESSVAGELRRASVAYKKGCNECYVRFICGGGDGDHSFVHGGSFLDEDPYSRVHEWLLMRAISDLATERKVLAGRSGFDSPVVTARRPSPPLLCPKIQNVMKIDI